MEIGFHIIYSCPNSTKASRHTSLTRVFPRPFRHGGGTSAGGQSVNGGGGLLSGDINLMGGNLTWIDYIIN